MATLSVFSLSDFHTADGLVVGPEWSDDCSRELLRMVRRALPAVPDDRLAEEPAGTAEFLAAVKVFHEVLSPGMYPGSDRWPLFCAGSSRPSLFKTALKHAHDASDFYAICRLSDAEALLAWNLARWMLRIPQQRSATMVFVQPPPAHLRSRVPRREVAALPA